MDPRPFSLSGEVCSYRTFCREGCVGSGHKERTDGKSLEIWHGVVVGTDMGGLKRIGLNLSDVHVG